MAVSINASITKDYYVADVGDTVQFGIYIVNTGDEIINTISLGSSLGLVYTPTEFGGVEDGDANEDGNFDPDEYRLYTSDYTITQGDVDSNIGLTEHVFLTASGIGSSETKLLKITVPLVEVLPNITVTQTAFPNPAKVGDEVTFAINVTNTGNVDSNDIIFTTSTFPVLPFETVDLYNTGDENKDGLFNVGETWNFFSNYTITQTDIEDEGSVDGIADNALTNTVTAEAFFGEGVSFASTTSTSVDLITKFKQINLIPEPSLVSTHQYLVIEPTVAPPPLPSDIHIRSGGDINTSSANIVLGGENNCVRVSDSLSEVEVKFISKVKLVNSTSIASNLHGGELAFEHGLNVCSNVFARTGIASSSSVIIDFGDYTIPYNQFSSIKCFTQARDTNGQTEAFDYIVVSDGISSVVGQDFNRVNTGALPLVSLACSLDNSGDTNRITLTYTNVANSGNDIDFASYIVGIRSDITEFIVPTPD